MTLRPQVDRIRARLRDREAAGEAAPHETAAAPGDGASGARADIDARVERSPDLVDVDALLAKYTVEELNEAAEEYYRGNLGAADHFFSKPFSAIAETPELLTCFAQVLAGVRPVPGMRVLDFGAGTGWTSRALAQLGCEVVVCDISETALRIAGQLFERQPLAGDRPAPTFLHYDGHRLDLPDASVDRALCVDAFHHVPNPEAVIGEIGRVLKPGGIAGFQEPGPNHSVSEQSQYEMRNYTVVENDIRMRDIERWATAAGFADVRLAVFASTPFLVSIDGFESFLGGGGEAARYDAHVREYVRERRIFFLHKAGGSIADSRDRAGLVADLSVAPAEVTVPAGGTVTATLRIENTGPNLWLPSGPGIGAVFAGVHLSTADARLLDRDHARCPLPRTRDEGIGPGDGLEVRIEVPAPPEPGRYLLDVDLVAEHVGWFEMNGTRPATIALDVT